MQVNEKYISLEGRRSRIRSAYKGESIDLIIPPQDEQEIQDIEEEGQVEEDKREPSSNLQSFVNFVEQEEQKNNQMTTEEIDATEFEDQYQLVDVNPIHLPTESCLNDANSPDEKIMFKASNIDSNLNGRGTNDYQLTTNNEIDKSGISPSFLDQML